MDHEVDAVGLKCPEPVMMLHAAMRRVAPGDIVRLTATDPSTQRDVAKSWELLGHHLLDHTAVADHVVYRVRKAG